MKLCASRFTKALRVIETHLIEVKRIDLLRRVGVQQRGVDVIWQRVELVSKVPHASIAFWLDEGRIVAIIACPRLVHIAPEHVHSDRHSRARLVAQVFAPRASRGRLMIPDD